MADTTHTLTVASPSTPEFTLTGAYQIALTGSPAHATVIMRRKIGTDFVDAGEVECGDTVNGYEAGTGTYVATLITFGVAAATFKFTVTTP